MPLFLAPTHAEARAVFGATTQYSLPGVETSTSNVAAIAANTARYSPIYVATPIVIDQMALEITTNSAASTTCRMGIYNADRAWQPTTLVVDAGTVAADSNGVKTASVNVALSPGRYLLVINSDAGPTLRIVRGGARYFGIANGIGASPFNIDGRVAQTYGAFPATGDQWGTNPGGSTPIFYFCFVRIATP